MRLLTRFSIFLFFMQITLLSAQQKSIMQAPPKAKTYPRSIQADWNPA
jgi:hypothetical protein